MEPAEEGTYCGIVNVVNAKPIKYTEAPTTSPTYDKDFVVAPYTKCAGDINWNRAKLLEQYTHVDQCQRRCKQMPKCKSYQWNGRQNTCILIKYKVQSEAVPQNGPTRVCGSIAITTNAPTRSPVIAAISTKSPVALIVASTKAPSVSVNNGAGSGEQQRKIKPKEGKSCVHGKVHDVLIKLGPENQRVGRCKEKCLLDEKCVAMQFAPPKRCSLWYTPIDSVRNILTLICYSLLYLSE